MRSRWTRALVLAALALLAGGLRWVGMELSLAPGKLIGDEVYYAWVAGNIARGRGHVFDASPGFQPVALRPPAHAWALSLLTDSRAPLRREEASKPERRLLAFQVVLGTTLVLLTAWLGEALFDARTGLAAGLVAAVYPTFVAHSHYLWSETFFAVLVTAALVGVVTGERKPSAALAALTGLLFGVAALTREIAIPIATVAGAWWLATAAPEGRRAALGRTALMLATAALVVLPWTVRNTIALGRMVPVATIGWFAAAEGNALDDEDWLHSERPRMHFKARYFEHGGEIERMDYAREQTLAMIRAGQPSWIGKKLVRNLALLLRPDFVLFYKLTRGSYGDVRLGVVRSLLVASVLAYLAVVVAGVLGMARAPGRGRRLLPWLVFATVAAVHVLSNATARYRMPWMPLLIVYASHAAVGARRAPRRLPRGSAAVAAAALLFFFGVGVPHFRAEATRLWLHGTAPLEEPAHPDAAASGQPAPTRAP